ncbi:GH36-type glycosyl hydrolase domain-containing protein [bacterium]
MSSKPKRIENPYGYHDIEAREYVITRPDTPTPWINYLGEGRYGGIISNTAGGFSFERDPRNRRVSRYRYNAIPMDQPGRYVYLRDQETGEFWSPTWQPVLNKTLEDYECRHGTAYTKIRSKYQEIVSELLYFVPPTSEDEECPCELWIMRVKNESDRPRKIRSFSYVEFSFYDAIIDTTNLDWGGHIVQSKVKDDIIITYTQFRDTKTFFSSNQKPAGFDTDRELFLGKYRDLSNPIVIETGIPKNSEAPRGNNIGSLCHDIELKPGEEKEIVFIMGVTDDQSKISPVVKKYRNRQAVTQAYDSLIADWDAYLGTFEVETPDAELDVMLNFWNAVQCRANLYWSRFVSGYDTGLGRGMGTRDSAQDTLGTVHNLPDHARETLTMLWKLQYPDGHAWHQVFPLTGEGGAGLAEEIPEWPQWFSDDHLWLIIGTCGYLKETGDYAYLGQKIKYWEGEDVTVWEHMLQAIEFTLNNIGPQGLPRIGFSDWNDTMNIDHGSGKAESVWTGMQFCYALLQITDLCEALGKTADAERFGQLHKEMANVINQTAWDGAWYSRAYDNEGKPIGVKGEKFNEISLNTQTWSVMAQLGDISREEQAMESAHKILNTPFGLKVMTPPYNEYQRRIQGTTTFPPGAKENGGIFCHANTWAIVAAAQLGWGDRAYQYYTQISPLARKDADVYLAEPYVYCQNICSPEHPNYGMGRNTWLTGTSSWTYVAGTQWILGIRPTYHGLQIAPAIPESWPGFKAKRIFRGITYQITVNRVGKGNHVKLIVDGQAMDGDTIPLPDQAGLEVKVVVELGK